MKIKDEFGLLNRLHVLKFNAWLNATTEITKFKYKIVGYKVTKPVENWVLAGVVFGLKVLATC